MKKRTYIVGIVVALALWLWFWQTYFVPRERSKKSGSANALSSVAKSEANDDIIVEDLGRIPGSATDEEKRGRILELRQIMSQANQSVRFWGKVVDQANIPLPDVKVKISVRHTVEILPGSIRDVFDYLDLVTDAQGMFSVSGRKGALLGIEEIKKEGYEAPYTGNRTYWYAPPIVTMQFTPDETRPEVFHMWKKIGSEKLVHKGIGTGIPYDGTSARFDLVNGQQVASGGDVRIALIRTPLQIKRGQQKYDWSATIEAVDGGVITSTDEFMYLAPETGYEPKFTISVSAEDPKWRADKRVSFYLKSHGTYSRVTAEFMTDSERSATGFQIDAYTNPTGSRNLEYDPMQDVAPLSSPPKPNP